MKLDISTPFAYYIADGVLDFDFTDIRNDKRITYQETVDVKDMKSYHYKYFRVLESYPSLRDALTDRFNLFLQHTFGNIESKISTSWLTNLRDGDRITRHTHANCFYSGILYFGKNYDDTTARLTLENPLANQLHTIIPQYYRAHNSHHPTLDNIALTPVTGGFHFFPAHIAHYSTVHTGEDRQSLAFNFVINSNIYCKDSTQFHHEITN
tara:strand:+ start:37 stop:666 length:630 start_codon:yes stop_codon:yes gene_type:complete